MQRFSEYKYERLDMEEVESKFQKLIERFKSAENYVEQDRIMTEINEIRNTVDTMINLVELRNSIDTEDAFYDAEMDYVDEVQAIFDGLNNSFYSALLGSDFRSAHEKKWGPQVFRLAELSKKTFDPNIIEDLKLENKLSSLYTKLKASAKIPFDGADRNLEEMVPYTESIDSERRIQAHKAISDFYHQNEAEFDEIYDQMIEVRHRIAQKLGYENFIEVGYARMQRSDYDAEMTANLRKQILEVVVPLASELRARQAKRLNLDALMHYDEPLTFLGGNATPKGNADWILENGKRMYKEISPETHDFFEYMKERELMDLVAKKGKSDGGFCTFLHNNKAPFIFSNFNGTSADIDVLTHEAGHAFQCYLSKDYRLPEYVWPTTEASEIHSTSMELLTWPWMDLFFEEEAEKFKFAHLSTILLLMPYMALVDEFQHWVYANPEASPNERKGKWREFERAYLPYRDYGDDAFLERGGYWFRQIHIFADPFYYIDYALATICSFELWLNSIDDREKAWQDYLRLCKAGGSHSFLELVELANLSNPFEEGAVKRVIDPIASWINDVDDSKM